MLKFQAHECVFAARASIFFITSCWPFLFVWIEFCSVCVLFLFFFFCVLSCPFEDNDENTDNSGYCHHGNFMKVPIFSSLTKEHKPRTMNVKCLFFKFNFSGDVFFVERSFNDIVVRAEQKWQNGLDICFENSQHTDEMIKKRNSFIQWEQRWFSKKKIQINSILILPN